MDLLVVDLHSGSMGSVSELAASADLTHLRRPGRHIRLMAGSEAKHEI